MLDTLRRVAATTPDAATAAFFVYTWIHPLGFGTTLVGDLLLLMLLEFLLVHSGAFIGSIVLSPTTTRWKKTLGVLGFGAFYMLFVLGFAFGMNRPWAIHAFLWLLVARLAMVWLAPVPRDDEIKRQQALWGGGALLYILGVFATSILPVPELGLTAEVRAQLGIAATGKGLWQQKPQTVLAFGMLYFTAMACLRWKLAAPKNETAPASTPVPPSTKWPWPKK